MKKRIQILCLGILGICALLMTGCQEKQDDVITLRVSNWEEYIDEGDWGETIELENGTILSGENSLVSDFEQWYYDTYHQKVKVEYSTFGTNEDLYNQMSIGDTFDLICPSEYLAMKLMDEGKLLPYSEEFYDTSKEENYYVNGVSPYIYNRLQKLQINGESVADYAAGYMWGTLGFVYNPDVVTREEAEDWNILLNQKFYKQITTKDSVRDCYIAALGILTTDEVLEPSFLNREDYEEELAKKLNDTSQERVEEVSDILTNVRKNVYAFETDSGKADLVTGKVVANLQWSGDAVYSMDQAAEDGVDLKYAVPKASTNLWFDGWCMLKSGINGDAKKQQAAQAFVNFLARPDNAVRNMYYIGYTSVISGGSDDTVYQYLDYCYGDEEGTESYDLNYFFGQEDSTQDYVIQTTPDALESQLYAQYPPEDVIHKSVVMGFYPDEANKRINRMWIDIRCFQLK